MFVGVRASSPAHQPPPLTNPHSKPPTNLHAKPHVKSSPAMHGRGSASGARSTSYPNSVWERRRSETLVREEPVQAAERGFPSNHFLPADEQPKVVAGFLSRHRRPGSIAHARRTHEIDRAAIGRN